LGARPASGKDGARLCGAGAKSQKSHGFLPHGHVSLHKNRSYPKDLAAGAAFGRRSIPPIPCQLRDVENLPYRRRLVSNRASSRNIPSTDDFRYW
jgi:hypothetical protein